MTNFDFHLYKNTVIILIFAFILWVFGNYYLPLYSGTTVFILEQIQSIMLLFMVFYSYFYAKKQTNSSDKYHFWLWTVFWWLLLFGRGISWGRDFLPEVPKIYFRIISIILISLVVVGFLMKPIRREILRRFKTEKIPVWNALLAFVYLGIADIAEHHRIGSSIIVSMGERQDLIEELMEIPCFLSLIFVVLYLQRNDLNKSK